MYINERQRRSDEPTANAVARALNILAVRDAELARRYMRHKNVPDHVIARVLHHPALLRREVPDNRYRRQSCRPHRTINDTVATATAQPQAEICR